MSTDKPSSIPEDLWAEANDTSPRVRSGIEQVWRLAGDMEPEPVAAPDDDAALEDVLRRIETVPGGGAASRPDRAPIARRGAATRRRRWTISAAAALLAVAGLGFLWRLPVTVNVPAGRQANITLPDGSSVELNSGTTLRYHRGFALMPLVPSAVRRVELEGEAFFDVARDGRPFVVATFNAETQVLGTTFNVRVRSGETRVTLASGRVQVQPTKSAGEPVILSEAGETAIVRDAVEKPAAGSDDYVSLEHTLSWRQKGFVFITEPLDTILAEFERRFGVDVSVEGDLAMEERMTVQINRDATPERILDDICLSLDCRYRRSSQGFTIYEPPR